jgi:anti-sigma factor RsiW
MKCEQQQENISQLLDGEFAREETAAVFRHLAECAECRSFFLSVQEVRHALLVDPGFPEDASWKDEDHASSAQQEDRLAVRGSVRLLRRTIPVPAPLVAAAAILVLVLSFLAAPRVGGPKVLEERERVVYVMTLPTVEVVGNPIMQPASSGEERQ